MAFWWLFIFMQRFLDVSKTKTCGQVFADSAYANKRNDKKLGKQNNKVLHRAYRNTPLTNKQKQDNRQRSSVRYIVERTFGLLKLHHGLGKARYLGLERNKTRANWLPWVIILKQGWIFLNRCENCRIVASNGWNKGKNRREIAKKCKQSVLFLGFEESENNFEKLQKLGLKQ